MTEDKMGRGSDDTYCSTYPGDGHFFISRSVNAPPIKWVDICQFCDHISSAGLRDQLSPGSFVVEADIARSEELRPERLGPTQDDVTLSPLPPLPAGEIRPAKTLG